MATTAPLNPCALLTLPLELRLDIYERVFASGESTGDYIDLFQASPTVDRSLLFTCHQTYGEAKQLYQSACRRYWKHNTFTIEFDCPVETQLQPLCERIRQLALDERSLALVSDVEIVAVDRMEVMKTRERRRLHDGTSKAGLMRIATEFCRKFDLLLYKQWYEEFMTGNEAAYR